MTEPATRGIPVALLENFDCSGISGVGVDACDGGEQLGRAALENPTQQTSKSLRCGEPRVCDEKSLALSERQRAVFSRDEGVYQVTWGSTTVKKVTSTI